MTVGESLSQSPPPPPSLPPSEQPADEFASHPSLGAAIAIAATPGVLQPGFGDRLEKRSENDGKGQRRKDLPKNQWAKNGSHYPGEYP